MSTPFDEAAQVLRSARRLIVFTGAGVSAESGIPTFRDDDGYWREFPPEPFARWKGILRTAAFQPSRLAEFLLKVIGPIATARPNAAHRAIESLEKSVSTIVITQNVDGLHQEAGSTTVWEIHGTFFEIVTLRGRFVRLLSRRELLHASEKVRRAERGLFKRTRLAWAVRHFFGLSWSGLRRPKLVLFGDQMAEPDWSRAQVDAAECDVMLVVGTSAQVWPAATLRLMARDRGARIIEVSPDEPAFGGIWLQGPAADVLPRIVQNAFPNDS